MIFHSDNEKYLYEKFPASKCGKMVKDLSKINECPDCASTNIVHSDMREQIICRDCGLIYEPLGPKMEAKFERSHAFGPSEAKVSVKLGTLPEKPKKRSKKKKSKVKAKKKPAKIAKKKAVKKKAKKKSKPKKKKSKVGKLAKRLKKAFKRKKRR